MKNKKLRELERNNRKNTIQEKEFNPNEDIKLERKIRKANKKKKQRKDKIKNNEWVRDLLDEEYEELILKGSSDKQ